MTSLLSARPLVTVVVPVHNRETLLSQSLDSVLGQTWPKWECVIVDDHSADGSLAVAQAYVARDKRFRVYSLPDPLGGPSAGRNLGLSKANGLFVNFLDSDDLFVPHKLETHLACFEEDEELDFVNCRYGIFTDSTDAVYQAPYPPQSQHLEYLLLGSPKISPWQSGCPMWRVERLREIGGWAEDLFGPEDLELFLRAAGQRLRTRRIEKTLYLLRRGDQDRISQQPRFEMVDQLRQLYLKSWPLLEANGLTNELRRYLCATHFYARALLLAKSGQRRRALGDFLRDTRFLGESLPRTILGISLLIARMYRPLGPLVARLNRRYLSHRNQLLPLLPGLEELPDMSVQKQNAH